MKKPKDHTMIFSGASNDPTIHEYKIYYADYDKFEYLPIVAQSEETRKEYEEYWKWSDQNIKNE